MKLKAILNAKKLTWAINVEQGVLSGLRRIEQTIPGPCKINETNYSIDNLCGIGERLVNKCKRVESGMRPVCFHPVTTQSQG